MATAIVRAIDTFLFSPQAIVIFMSLGFIGFVTVLHIIGKVRWHSVLHRCMHWSPAAEPLLTQRQYSIATTMIACSFTDACRSGRTRV